MRSELISAELYELPTQLIESAGQFVVACGNHVMTHTLKSGKLLDCSEALPFKTKRMILCGAKLIISGSSSSVAYEMRNGALGDHTPLGEYEVLSSFGSVSVVLTKSSHDADRVLGYIEGELSADSQINCIYSGFIGKVSQSSGIISAIVGRGYKKLFVYDLSSKSSREFQHDHPMTCIAAHPQNEEISAGDNSGQIVRFSLSNDSQRHYAYHHWHHSPVSSLQYSSTGSVLLSGAEEGVMCIWNNAASGTRPQFIPHLGGPIAHITCGTQYAIVSLKTNKILVIDMFTRQIQATVLGTLHDTTFGSAQITPVDTSGSIVAITTSSHCQLFDTVTRKPISKNPIAIQNRNYIPSNLRQRIASRPWTTNQVAVLQDSKDASVSYMMAALSRRRVSKVEVVVKFFVSRNQGLTWTMESVVMNAHKDTVKSILAIPAMGGFISVGADGSIKQWMQSTKEKESSIWKISKSTNFKNSSLGPIFISCSDAGLVIIGYEKFVTLWDPIRLIELTNGSLSMRNGNGDEKFLAGGLIEGTTELFTLNTSGLVELWELRTFEKISSLQIEDPLEFTSNGNKKNNSLSTIFAIVENRMLIASNSSNCMFSVTRNENGELIGERILVSPHSADRSVSSICKVGQSGAIVATNKGRTLYRFTKGENANENEFRIPDEDADLDMMTVAAETMGDDESQTLEKETKMMPTRKVFQPLSALIAKLFPIENELDSLPDPETGFHMLARELMVASK